MMFTRSVLSFCWVAAATGLTAPALAQTLVGDAKAGETKAAMCIGCHGIKGYQNAFPQVHRVPMIAGQAPGYLVAALNAYQKGERKHPTMRGIAASLSAQDMADLAAYYSALAGVPPVPEAASHTPSAAVAALLEKGACVSCHGASFSKPIDPSYPKLGGQYADYLFVALNAYNVQNSPVVGRGNPIMAGIAGQFKPAELRLLANYLGSLNGELKTVAQSKFR